MQANFCPNCQARIIKTHVIAIILSYVISYVASTIMIIRAYIFYHEVNGICDIRIDFFRIKIVHHHSL
jgi:hypothetical protein